MKKVLVILMVIGLGLVSCASVPTRAEITTELQWRLEDPDKSLILKVGENMPGVKVYGISNDGTHGEEIGTTPITLAYTSINGEIWGTVPDETLTKDMSISRGIFGKVSAALWLNLIFIKDDYLPHISEYIIKMGNVFLKKEEFELKEIPEDFFCGKISIDVPELKIEVEMREIDLSRATRDNIRKMDEKVFVNSNNIGRLE